MEGSVSENDEATDLTDNDDNVNNLSIDDVDPGGRIT